MVTHVTEHVVECLNERFCKLITDPVVKAACIFEHSRWPSFETDKDALNGYGTKEIDLLLVHYKVLFGYLGGDADKVQREWKRLKIKVMRDPALRSRKYLELYEDRFDHDSEKKNDQHFYNVLLLVAIVLSFAVDTSICERGFSLMNNLKTVRRSQMGNTLLRMLMVICSLGEEWKDPSKIPVAEIIEEWRSHSSRGRYKDNIWRPEILNDLVGSGSGASTGSGVPSVGSGEGDREEQVDAFEAGGLFRMFGRMANQDAVRARAFPPASGLPTPR